MIAYRKIKEVREGDTLCNASGEPLLEVINNEKGLLTVYEIKTGFFSTKNLRKNYQNGDSVRVEVAK